MRIISDFHDFYDSVMGHNYHSDDNIYLRSPKEIELQDELIPHMYYYRPYVIGFCGQTYPVIKLDYMEGSSTIYKICYSIEECDVVSENFENKAKEMYQPKIDNRQRTSRQWWYERSHRGKIEKFFNEISRPNKFAKFFQTYRCPIFTIKNSNNRISNSTLTINDSLNRFEFYKIFDSYTAFQELEMYTSGPLAPPVKQIPVLSDEIMIESHGFDKKTSFRKGKSKK